jgi:hypothetical protein
VKAFKEITEWETDFVMPNHVYFLSDSKDKMYGYVKSSTGEIQEMGTPYKFKASGRKFQEVPNTWGYEPGQAAEPEGRSWTVAGSKGANYTVTELNGQVTCSCPGHKYRGTCKHIKETV